MGRVTVPIFPACRFGSPTDAASDEILRLSSKAADKQPTQRKEKHNGRGSEDDHFNGQIVHEQRRHPRRPRAKAEKKQHEHGRHQLHGQQDYAQNKPHGGDRHGTLLLL